jgi:hypothetical protein
MDIDFLYYEECPSHDEALARLRRILDQEQIEAEIDVIRVETEEQANELRFTGSPTIRIDGEDIDPVSPDTPYALACRAYQKTDGRITPLPPVELIRHALRAAARH